MKRYIPIVLVLSGLASVHAATATDGAALATRMDDCFRKHAQLIEKPALKNVQTCWRVHGYLMDRQ